MTHLSITAVTATKYSFDVRPYHYPCSSQFRRRSIIIPLAPLSKHHHHHQHSKSSSSSSRRRNSLREKLLSFPSQDQHQHQDSHLVDGCVSVNMDGVIKRSHLPEACSSDALEDVIDSKIVKSVLLVEDNDSSLIRTVQSLSIWDVPFFRASHPRAATMVFCAFCILAAMPKLFFASGRVELKREEVEMLRRKKKLRMEKEKFGKGRVKIMQNVQGLPMTSDARPQLDRNELIRCIEHAEKSGTNLLLPDSPCHHNAKDCDFYSKVKETSEMSREVQELERQNCAQNDERGKGNELSSVVRVSKPHTTVDACIKPKPMNLELNQGRFSEMDCLVDCGNERQLSRDIEKTKVATENNKDSINIVSDGETSKVSVINTNIDTRKLDDHETDAFGFLKQIPPTLVENIAHRYNSYTLGSLHDLRNEVKHNGIGSIGLVEKKSSCITSCTSSSVRNIPKVMKSVKKAKGYLLEKHGVSTDKLNSRQEVQLTCSTAEVYNDVGSVSLRKESFANEVYKTNFHEAGTRNAMSSMKIDENEVLGINNLDLPHDISTAISGEPSSVSLLAHTSNFDYLVRDKTIYPGESLLGTVNVENSCSKTTKIKNLNVDSPDLKSAVGSLEESCLNNDGNASQFKCFLDAAQESGDKHDVEGLSMSEKSFQFDSAGSDYGTETLEIKGHANWIEDNFQQFDPIIKMIGSGFRENYMVAKEKVHQSVVSAEVSELGLLGEDEELEWMNDEKLREIVFQVRDNELAGRDPFYLMDAVDQCAFFKGLELKAEMVNAKLLGLHEWVHSRIENLDYGADGISLDDPLEKIVPRWKGPIIDKELGFIDKFTENQMTNFAGNVEQSLPKSEELPYSKDVSPYSYVNDKTPNGASTSVNTLIECSDGSGRPGRKIGKEHWQHTKKWSRGFLEVYNSENDPEIKSIMKDMGKGLDKWITEKETQEVADLMTRVPKRKRRYIQKKMDKLKREVDMYGAQAVISKYKEYSDEKGEDYLWWLDLQFVLCIELYTVEDGVQKVGFYSLEMATDLELNPAQYHVIAFEDPGDSKNFCYILQAHMDMLGSGTGFVVARPPKDAFREAKANGFNVTVIRKGQVVFNVDQTLEEVEECITHIGSKMYHDKIMEERAVDIHSLMRGLVHADKAARR